MREGLKVLGICALFVGIEGVGIGSVVYLYEKDRVAPVTFEGRELPAWASTDTKQLRVAMTPGSAPVSIYAHIRREHGQFVTELETQAISMRPPSKVRSVKSRASTAEEIVAWERQFI